MLLQQGFTGWMDNIKPLVLQYGGQLIAGLAVLFLGWKVVGFVGRQIEKLIEKKELDPTVKPFIKSLFKIILRAVVLVAALGTMGVEMSAFAALLAATGVAIGLALSGTLQNFAGGLVVLILKPFRVGDVIETSDATGTVTEIQIFHTYLKTFDNKVVVLPNGRISSDRVTNYNVLPQRRVDFVFGIGYNDDLKQAKALLMEVIEKNEKILKDPAPFIGLNELGESSVNLVVRVWANTPDYWEVYFYMMEEVKTAFDTNGISIPFPQRELHIVHGENPS